jgi:predicted RNA binding protein YcfA (HicA-like mRNA interferase family)
LGKLRQLSAKELCKILSVYGIIEIRQKGSHIIMQKEIDNSTITIPVPNHSTIKVGTLQSIIRQADLPKEIFLTK